VKTELISAETDREAAVQRAVEVLRSGEPVALPTETVYGLAADALRPDAVLQVFAAKSRPRFDPLIVHLPGPDWAERIAKLEGKSDETFRRLCKRFWPGPLTFVYPRQAVVPDIVTAGLETVAFRLSAHPVFSEIVQQVGSPLAAPSANRFGRISPTTAAHVLDELGGLIPLIVDAGPTVHGLESTIVALRNDRIEILRPGPITQELLAEFGQVVVAGPSPHPEAPGQLPSHYAPNTRLILVDNAGTFVPAAGQRLGLLSWQTKPDAGFSDCRILSPRQDVVEAASNLFRYLRELDQQNLDLIVAEKVPDTGLGAAINDRLQRAAAKITSAAPSRLQ
jgi:L-threonylcarbamoyladenylate synthase